MGPMKLKKKMRSLYFTSFDALEVYSGTWKLETFNEGLPNGFSDTTFYI